MANSLGRLQVSLGLDAAEFTAGLTRAEVQAQKFAKNVNASILQVGKVLAGLELGRQFLDTTKEIISSAGALNDLADATGSSVESLSRLSNQAQIAGTDFATLQTLVLKLSAGMAGADDESSKVGKALKFLGVSAKDPVEALQQVAISLNNYADGTGKAALAVALFGKQGPAFLATLKDIAELQDVAATTTSKQAAEAENLEKAYRRLSVEATTFKNLVLNDLVPALAEIIGDFREGTKAAGGFFAAIRVLGTLNPFETLGEQLKTAQTSLADLSSRRTGQGDFITDLNGEVVDATTAFKTLNAQIDFTKGKIKRQALALIDPSNNDARDIIAQRKPVANFKIKDPADDKKAQVSEAQRLLESLQKQLDKTQELGEVERVLAEIRRGNVKGITPELEKQIIALAALIDMTKEADKEQEARKKLLEEIAQQEDAANKERQKNIQSAFDSAAKTKEGNDALKEEIAIILGGDEARKALIKARNESAIAAQQEALAVVLLNEGEGDRAKFIRAEIELLKERRSILVSKDIAENIKAEMDVLKAFGESLANEVGGAIADVVTGTKSFKDAFNDLAKSITKNLADIAAKSLANSLFGNTTGGAGGGDIFSIIAKLFAASGGGGASGGLGLGGFAAGTNFAPGGMAIVGERGPEIVDLPRGARVTPNSELVARREMKTFNITVNTHVMPGASTASARQTAAMVRDAVQRAVRDR